MSDDVDETRRRTLEMFASALAGHAMSVASTEPGGPAWTDGHTVYVDHGLPLRDVLAAVAVQASLMAAGSLDGDVLDRLTGHPRLARRYLAVEGHRALLANHALLPGFLRSIADHAIGGLTSSATLSLQIAVDKDGPPVAPMVFGMLRPGKIVATRRTEQRNAGAAHVPRRTGSAEQLAEQDDGVEADPGYVDPLTSPVGGGGVIGKWLKKMLSSARSAGDAGGPPGADTPTHRTNSARRGAHAVSSTAAVLAEDVADIEPEGFVYPEWDVARRSYRPGWCTVHEIEPHLIATASHAIEDAASARKPLSRLGLGLQRLHRQPQGDDIDIDAAVEARIEVAAGVVTDEAVYLDSLRRRRDLSVLLLLDISGSSGESGTMGHTVHQQQRAAAGRLLVALNDLGDRVALYAYYSQGRAAVNMLPVKRFDDRLDTRVIRRLNSLAPGAYSRLGAAIRHGSSIVERSGGTSRRLLVVISDGLAYDHGYERDHGAADARRALTEARRRGTGCVCLTIGAGTDISSLRAVFGTAAHAAVGSPDELSGVIGPMFRAALRSAEVRRATRTSLKQTSVPR